MYVNHIFSLRVNAYGSKKKVARKAAGGAKKMSKYVKPVISLDEGMAEGVYAASGCLVGKIADESYEGGMGNKYRFAVYYTHETKEHSNTAQTVVVKLNAPINVVDGSAQNFLQSGNGTDTLTFVRNSSMNNSGADQGMFNVVVQPVTGDASSLKATLVSITDTRYTV